VKSVRIEFSPDALEQIRAVHDWWRIHRPAATELLREEFAASLEITALGWDTPGLRLGSGGVGVGCGG
jgi:hypothetical protein